MQTSQHVSHFSRYKNANTSSYHILVISDVNETSLQSSILIFSSSKNLLKKKKRFFFPLV